MRNALVPVVTLVGLSLPFVFAGTLISEEIFNYPGMGLLFYNAAVARDYPVLLGVTLVVGAATVIGSLLADICYALLDPRVRCLHAGFRALTHGLDRASRPSG